jgi:hypothetical protein
VLRRLIGQPLTGEVVVVRQLSAQSIVVEPPQHTRRRRPTSTTAAVVQQSAAVSMIRFPRTLHCVAKISGLDPLAEKRNLALVWHLTDRIWGWTYDALPPEPISRRLDLDRLAICASDFLVPGENHPDWLSRHGVSSRPDELRQLRSWILVVSPWPDDQHT